MNEAKTMKFEDLFSGGGEMGALMRSYDWSSTSLGSPEHWSQSLKTSVRIMLTSRQPMWVWWGEELINLYNDAYRSILGGKHPKALGQPASVVWREIWDQVGPRAAYTMLNNEGTYDEALLLIMERNGYPEETYYTFSYSPIPDDQGGTGGILCANTESTQNIIGERQLALLRELAAKTVDARTFDEACTLSVDCLKTNPYDLPFAMIYLVDPEQNNLRLAGTSGIKPGHAAVPEIVPLDSDSVWPFAKVIETQQTYLMSDLESSFGSLPTGAWKRSPNQAIIVPITALGQTRKAGILVAGLNPYRLFDDGYQGFIALVTAQIAASIANAQAYEEERKRAEALAELDRAKTVFFSNVIHEFRTPLTLMLGPLGDLLADPSRLSQSDREHLMVAYRNSQRLLKLVNTLLDFARIEAGRIEAVYEPTDLALLTTDLAGGFRSIIEGAGLRFRVDCPPLSEPAYVDREMWEKIVLNLLSNAFKFTFAGEITITLRSHLNQIELKVQDTGTGIPAEELPHIFERFHRVKGSKGRSYEGSGIGLSLVQELVQLQGGSIKVSSIFEQGTCFTVTLPSGCAHLPRERIAANRTLVSTALGMTPYLEEALRWLPKTQESSPAIALGLPVSLPTRKPCTQVGRIVLADDNADMRDYLERLLSQCYDVETVGDGVAALAAIRRQMPNLLLTDVMMPELDGFELLRQLRSDPQTKELPIILLSARAGEESRIDGLNAGADDYLIKPFSAQELLARIEATLKMARVRQEAMLREQALRVEVQTAKDILESILCRISDQFLALNRDWYYTYVNDRVPEVSGLSKEELLGKSIWELFPDTVGTQFQSEVHRAMTEQISVQFEYFYPRWQRWFENRVYPSVDGLSIFIADITERKQAELQMQAQAQEVNQLNAYLKRSTSELAKRNQELDRFAYVVSHDLKAPLRAINNLSVWIEEDLSGQIPEGTQHQLELLRQRVSRMETLIDGLLVYSRAGRTELEEQMTDVGKLIDEIIDSLMPPATFSIEIKTPLPHLVTKRLLLSQIFANLISNAVKHHDRSEGRIEIASSQLGDYYEFSISDDGPGIAPQDHEKIFQIFQTLKAQDVKESTGIGLSIVKKIVEAEGGAINVESHLGQGTTFRFTWPMSNGGSGEPTPKI